MAKALSTLEALIMQYEICFKHTKGAQGFIFEGTLEQALDQGRIMVEKHGWKHERQYATQPKAGALWADPTKTSFISVLPVSE